MNDCQSVADACGTASEPLWIILIVVVIVAVVLWSALT